MDVFTEQGEVGVQGVPRSTRPGLRKARQLIDADAADALVVWRLDRARSQHRGHVSNWSESSRSRAPGFGVGHRAVRQWRGPPGS